MSSSSPMEIISRACDLLEAWTGFALRETAPHRLTQAFSRRAEALGYSAPLDYLDALRNLDPTAEEPQKLINLITNGLTAFWRDEPQLSALRYVLTHLHSHSLTSSPVHIWCAGVSTGEEAFTVAMIADEESVPVRILGTDINTDFLLRATTGIYGPWSLRRLSDHRRRTYFKNIDDHRFQVDHPAFENVEFAHHNLLSPPPLSRATNGTWDIILCRNVLIYFSSEATTNVLRHLAGALSREGYLLFGSSEQIHFDQLGPHAPYLRPIQKGGGFLYRPASVHTGHTIKPGHWNLTPSPSPSDLPSFQSTLDETTSDVTENDTVLKLMHNAAEHLVSGSAELAIACLEACLGYDPFQLEAHCLMGTALQTIGATHPALEAFQKALFLEPHHWFAAFRSATIHQTHLDIDAARRSFHHALTALNHPSDPMESSHILLQLLGPLDDLRLQSRRQAEDFLILHGLPASQDLLNNSENE